ncbi:hypothetical protein [Halomonas organivorans]|uniref:hypothetical protein n=1 Tax=Halomonas organivorans TaxID=257772 RepID=UPI003631D51B
MDELERTVAAGNTQVTQLGFSIDIMLPKLMSMTGELREMVETLKMNLKSFTHGLFHQIFSGYEFSSA